MKKIDQLTHWGSLMVLGLLALIFANLLILLLPALWTLVLRTNILALIIFIGCAFFVVFCFNLIYGQPFLIFLFLPVALLISFLAISAINGADGHCKVFSDPLVYKVTKINTEMFPGVFPTLERRIKSESYKKCEAI